VAVNFIDRISRSTRRNLHWLSAKATAKNYVNNVVYCIKFCRTDCLYPNSFVFVLVFVFLNNSVSRVPLSAFREHGRRRRRRGMRERIFSHFLAKNQSILRKYHSSCNRYFNKPHKNLSMPVFNICISKPQQNLVTTGSCFHSAQNSIRRIFLIRTDILLS